MLGRGVGERLAAAGPRSVFSPELRDAVAGADCVIANLECCISTRGEKWDPGFKRFHFRAPPSAVETLLWLGVDCVTIANNHALDYGYAALLDTLRYLGDAGVTVVGGGSSVVDARRGAVIAKNGCELGVLGFADHQEDFAATRERPGTAFADIRTHTPRWVTDAIQELRTRSDAVLVTPHWGPNMTVEPLPEITRCANTLLDAGASLIAGHSAHVFHGIAPNVIYDLGDAVDDYMRYPDVRNDLGIIAFAEIGRPRVGVLPVKLTFCHTSIARGEDREWVTRRLMSACAKLGTEVSDEGEMLLVQW